MADDPAKTVWVCKDKRRMLVSEMGNAHLLNAHAFIGKRLRQVVKMEILAGMGGRFEDEDRLSGKFYRLLRMRAVLSVEIKRRGLKEFNDNDT